MPGSLRSFSVLSADITENWLCKSNLEHSRRFSVNRLVIRPALLGLLMLAYARAATSYTTSTAEPPPVAREFRGAWVAAVNNIDWPSKRTLTTAQQKAELLAILDKCAALKLNVVVLQVRPACDALYASKLEPWSEYLTGTQGRAPNPFWDPLEFAVREAHQRGLELHAWFNPFRARHSTGTKTYAAANHLSQTRPDLVKTYGTHLWLDPGLQEVQDHSARVILDVVQRYDIDGVHVDDYFYPYREKDAQKVEIPFPDGASWAAYQRGGGKLARDDWRRDNVNRFIARMYREVKAAKPWVQVGISPFGIYRPGHPAQIKGFDQYESLFADPRAWLANGWLDYLAPQLYWRIDPPGQSFPVLLKWWTENNPKQRQIVAGINTTAVGTQINYTVTDAGNKGWPASEIARQIQLTRQQKGIAGHIHWNMGALMKNKGGVATELAGDEYRQTALPPAAQGTGKTLSPPALAAVGRGRGVRLQWSAAAGETARLWIVQTRRGTAWQTEILPGNDLSREFPNPPDAVAVSAVDAYGKTSRPRVLARTGL
jgi:uncharacterized lipoprotein YddW (UPF0748 family)